ncbi:MAG: chemotaxis protein CheW [candidate division Zixibacteria bacterium]|nr:chemotaxis protein CheW [candidate division Zixibacteria bacterium]
MAENENTANVTADELLQLVSFKIGSEEYGIDILKVQEINRMPDITKVPQAAHYVDGVINLRGKVIPIINTRRKFSLDEKDHDKDTRIVVVDINSEVIGLIVDSVNEVLRIPNSIVEPPPNVTIDSGADYITGVARLEDRLLILLDLGKLVGDTAEQMSEITEEVFA